MTLITLLGRVSLKHIRHQKARTIIAICGIALGVSAMVAIDIVNASVVRSLEDSINHVTGRAVLQVTGSEPGFPEAMLDRVQEIPGIEYAVPVIETNAMLAAGSERSFVVLGVDVLQDSKVRDYSVTDESADIPDPLLFLAKPDSILLTREMAKREGIRIDQKIEVQTVQGLKTFTVRGLLDPEGPAKALGGDIAIMDMYAAQMAFGKDNRIDRIDVSILRGETLDPVKNRLRIALPEGYNIDTPAGRSRQIENLMARFRKSMDLISFMALFVGMYLIYNTVSISVVQRRREIGILRAIGATRGQISGLFLLEIFFFSLLASLLGVTLGLGLAKLSISAVSQNVSFLYGRSSVSELNISLMHLFKDAGFGVAASLLAAAFPARSSAHIAPAPAMRSLPHGANGVMRGARSLTLSLALIGAAGLIMAVYKSVGPASPVRNSMTTTAAVILLLLGVSLAMPLLLQRFIGLFHVALAPRFGAGGRLAGLNLQKNIFRNSVAAAAVFFSISLSVSSASMVNSARQGLMDYVDSVENSDILITSGHPLASAGAQNIPMPLSMARELEAIPGIQSADPFRKLFLNIAGNRILLEMVVLDRWMRRNTCTVTQGRMDDIVRLLPGQDNILVNETVAARMGLKPGDKIMLPTPAGLKPFGVASVIVSYASDSGVMIMDYATYERHWGDRVADMFSVFVVPGSDISSVRASILERFKTSRKMFVLPSLEFRTEIKKMLDRVFIMNDAVNVLTLIIAGFGIIVTLLASVIERTREIGILRSLGMTRRQVSGVVLIESALLGAVGGILGAAVGSLTGWINLEGFFRIDFGPSIAYHIHYTSIGRAMLLAIGLSVLAGFYPARRAAKTNVVEALAYE